MTDPRREWLKLRAGIDFAVRMNEAECRLEHLDKDGNVLRWITYAALFQRRARLKNNRGERVDFC